MQLYIMQTQLENLELDTNTSEILEKTMDCNPVATFQRKEKITLLVPVPIDQVPVSTIFNLLSFDFFLVGQMFVS